MPQRRRLLGEFLPCPPQNSPRNRQHRFTLSLPQHTCTPTNNTRSPRGAVPTGFHRPLLSTLPPKKLLMVLAGR